MEENALRPLDPLNEGPGPGGLATTPPELLILADMHPCAYRVAWLDSAALSFPSGFSGISFSGQGEGSLGEDSKERE